VRVRPVKILAFLFHCVSQATIFVSFKQPLLIPCGEYCESKIIRIPVPIRKRSLMSKIKRHSRVYSNYSSDSRVLRGDSQDVSPTISGICDRKWNGLTGVHVSNIMNAFCFQPPLSSFVERFFPFEERPATSQPDTLKTLTARTYPI